jgi:hypothetical protein
VSAWTDTSLRLYRSLGCCCTFRLSYHRKGRCNVCHLSLSTENYLCWRTGRCNKQCLFVTCQLTDNSVKLMLDCCIIWHILIRCCYITVDSATTALQNGACTMHNAHVGAFQNNCTIKHPFHTVATWKAWNFIKNYITLICLEKNNLFGNIIFTQNHAWHITKVVELTI